ncbi:hypothetical protein [Streptomyces sp. NPDC005969]|uniref:hypothetical protein n=1 Tax=Streptomyces sp. NPDC005969 TaxID=3156722 RepID=UPI0033D7DD78
MDELRERDWQQPRDRKERKGTDGAVIVLTVLAAMSGIEREYIRDRTLGSQESARKRGKAIGGAGVTDEWAQPWWSC